MFNSQKFHQMSTDKKIDHNLQKIKKEENVENGDQKSPILSTKISAKEKKNEEEKEQQTSLW